MITICLATSSAGLCFHGRLIQQEPRPDCLQGRDGLFYFLCSPRAPSQPADFHPLTSTTGSAKFQLDGSWSSGRTGKGGANILICRTSFAHRLSHLSSLELPSVVNLAASAPGPDISFYYIQHTCHRLDSILGGKLYHTSRH